MSVAVEIPTAITAAERDELERLAAGKRVLEIGALLGHSTVAMARVAESVVSVDPHEGYPRVAPRPTLLRFLENLREYGVRDRVVVCVAPDWQALPMLRERLFDLAFIDCDGEYETTLHAMRATVPLLRHHAALVVHDHGHPDWPGASRAIREFARERGTAFRTVDTLAVFEQTWPKL